MVFYVLINTDISDEEIEKDISKVIPKDVKFEYQSVYGVFDGVIKIYDKKNSREITENIKKLPKINSTMILTIA